MCIFHVYSKVLSCFLGRSQVEILERIKKKRQVFFWWRIHIMYSNVFPFISDDQVYKIQKNRMVVKEVYAWDEWWIQSSFKFGFPQWEKLIHVNQYLLVSISIVGIFFFGFPQRGHSFFFVKKGGLWCWRGVGLEFRQREGSWRETFELVFFLQNVKTRRFYSKVFDLMLSPKKKKLRKWRGANMV